RDWKSRRGETPSRVQISTAPPNKSRHESGGFFLAQLLQSVEFPLNITNKRFGFLSIYKKITTLLPLLLCYNDYSLYKLCAKQDI
ncbi:MAG: hypothetical protein RR049_04800, partial [Angelakisella sp.]